MKPTYTEALTAIIKKAFPHVIIYNVGNRKCGYMHFDYQGVAFRIYNDKSNSINPKGGFLTIEGYNNISDLMFIINEFNNMTH